MKNLAFSLGATALVALGAPGVSQAQVTQSYSYDANGRLTGAVTTGVAGTHTSAYAYDAANNRTSRSQTGVTAWAAISQLPTHQLLQPDEALVSPDGRYSFALRSSGRLELWSGEGPAISDSESLAAAFHVFEDGQARFLTSPPSEPLPTGTWVSLRDDGVLVLSDQAGGELWRSGAATGREAVQ